ncbi:double-CXXCG motif protein [Pyxidicoccus trucidator]|uniref:SitI6 family double-CXXCG motif immunity protein n=1 Tax=Pyxidicoccus trucidator TaxID=2709662 RepID=UPI0013DC8A72|nr:double-CXXCG motif protein [Pyxidicoccus trucidator]
MTRFFWMREDRSVAETYGGEVNAASKWSLPGTTCPACVTWAAAGHYYPCVDLSQLPERREFEKARRESFSEFTRLRELVRPLAPSGAILPPGTGFGPLVGPAFGRFPAFSWLVGVLMARRDALERLQAEDLRGLEPCRTALRFRQKNNPPELLDLQLHPLGKLHPDCIPPDAPPPCATCGRHGFGRPDEPILDAASLPTDLDLFRVGNFATMLIGTERFMEAVRRLELDGVTFRELPAR